MSVGSLIVHNVVELIEGFIVFYWLRFLKSFAGGVLTSIVGLRIGVDVFVSVFTELKVTGELAIDRSKVVNNKCELGKIHRSFVATSTRLFARLELPLRER